MSAAPGRPEILVACHDREAADQLRILLDARGYRTVIERSGAAIPAKAAANPPAAVIVSIRLPKLNGYEVLCELRRSEATKDIPVILLSDLTADLGTTDPEWAKLVEADAFFTEPLDAMALLAAVRQLVSAQSPAASNPAM